jgi:D-ribose pyranose/furanose isomerase RbsD
VQDEINIETVITELKEIKENNKDIERKLNSYLKELGFEEI